MKRLIWMLPLVAIVLGAITSYVFSHSTSRLLKDLGSVDSPAVTQTQSLISDLTHVVDGFKSAVAAADKAALESVTQKAGQFKADLQRYAAVPGRSAAAGQIEQQFDTYFKAANQVAGIMLDGQPGDVGESAQTMQAALTTLQAGLTRQKDDAKQALDTHIDETQALVSRGFLASVVTSLLTLGLSVGVSWTSVRALMKQLGGKPEEATRIVHRIAGGDLSEPVRLHDQSQTSLLYAMQGMQAQLAGVIGDVREAVDQVHRAADEISEGNLALAERSLRQATSLQASASSIDELTASVRSNADSASQAHQLATQASQEADEGGRAVAQAVGAMGEISERARKIAEITSLIDGIAFQTNILALNAAVEAARAGEQGRGFTVVAGEVGTLAQRAGAAAKEIKTLIEDSNERIEAGSRHVNAAGEAMTHLVDSVKQVGQFIAHISTASAQQRQGIEQVNRAVAELDSATQQNHALVEQAGQAAHALQGVARQLDAAVGKFRLDDGLHAIAHQAIASRDARRVLALS